MSTVNEKLTWIATLIRSNTGITKKLSLDDMADGVDEVFVAGIAKGREDGISTGKEIGRQEGIAEGKFLGKLEAQEEFWNNVPTQMRPRQFAGPAWNKNTFYPNPGQVFDCTYAGGYTNLLFRIHNDGGDPYDLSQRLKDCGASIDFSACTNGNEMFRQAVVTRIPEISAPLIKDWNYVFANCADLVTIDKLTASASATFTNTFQGCAKLENITFGSEIGKSISFANSPLLTYASVQGIIYNLKDLTGQTTQTLTLHANVGANLTDAQKAPITAKNWQLVY